MESYALLFIGTAAHAAQFASLALFKNPRTSTPPLCPLLLSVSFSLLFPCPHGQTSNGAMANASSSQNTSPSCPPPLNASDALPPSDAIALSQP